MKAFRIFFSTITFILILFFLSCSLNYGTEENSESTIPEFNFTNAVFSRYSNNKKTMEVNAEAIEQYKSDGNTYAKNADFVTFSNKGETTTSGVCDLLSADVDNEQYNLFDNININIYDKNITLDAQVLHFDGKTEQLTGSFEDEVSISKDDTTLKGTAFSASGISNTFSMISGVEGQIIQNESEKSESDEENSEIDSDKSE